MRSDLVSELTLVHERIVIGPFTLLLTLHDLFDVLQFALLERQ